MPDPNSDKRAAAEAALAEVAPGMLVGLGTGSTAAYVIDGLAARVRAGLRVRAVATSRATATLARAVGIVVIPFSSVARVDFTIDGVDEVDPAARAIKGKGGALLREKIVGAASDRMIAVADASKAVDRLGRGPVPVEVLPFARAWSLRALEALGGRPVLRGTATGMPARSDQGNLLVDVDFGPIEDPVALAARMSAIPGVLGHGLFLSEIDTVYIAKDGSIRRIDRRG